MSSVLFFAWKIVSKGVHNRKQAGGGRVATSQRSHLDLFLLLLFTLATVVVVVVIVVVAVVVAFGDDAADDGGFLHAAGGDGAPRAGRQGPRLLHAQTTGERQPLIWWGGFHVQSSVKTLLHTRFQKWLAGILRYFAFLGWTELEEHWNVSLNSVLFCDPSVCKTYALFVRKFWGFFHPPSHLLCGLCGNLLIVMINLSENSRERAELRYRIVRRGFVISFLYLLTDLARLARITILVKNKPV